MPEDPTIAVVNESTSISDAEVQATLPALQAQITDDFGPLWHTGATLVLTARGATAPAGAWQLAILDDSDQAGALGYHDLTRDGLPLAKAFAATARAAGTPWTVVASHELLEMLGDPYIDLTVFDQSSATSGVLYGFEACDPVEADTYRVQGVSVSDFVTAEWFGPLSRDSSLPLDRLGLVTAPLQIRPGGYIGVFDVTAGSGWTQRSEGAPAWECSRWRGRLVPRPERDRSERRRP